MMKSPKTIDFLNLHMLFTVCGYCVSLRLWLMDDKHGVINTAKFLLFAFNASNALLIH